MSDPSARRGEWLTSRRLELILLATERCNFRCTYCYERFDRGRMEPAAVEGVKRLLSARAGELDYLRLAWFGGEPLLARGVIRDLMGHARELRARHPRLHLYSDMATNGWLLTRPVLEEMTGLGVTTFQVTFDGPREWHDRRRLRVDGTGSFDRIRANLRAIRHCDGDFVIQVRLHVDGDNQPDIPRFLEQYRRDFAGDQRYQLFIRPVSRFGGPGDDRLDILDDGRSHEAIDNLRALAHRCGLGQVREEKTAPACFAARANSYVVRADGRVGKCTVALEQPENQVGRINGDGTLALDQELMRAWIRGVTGDDVEARACPLKGFPLPASGQALDPPPAGPTAHA